MKRTLAAILVSLLAIACALGGTFMLLHESHREVLRSTAAVITAMRDLARLETAEYHIERVIDVKDQQDLFYGLVSGEDAVLLIAAGDVVAGVDLSRLGPGDVTFDDKTRTATLRLPAPEVLAASLDAHRTYVHTRRTDLLATRNEQLEGRAREIAVASFRRAAIEGGILDRARKQAEQVIRAVVRECGAQQVVIKWK